MSGETANQILPSARLKSLGKYKLIASLAEGGMAKVYLGLMAGPAGFNKLLVIKVMNREDEGTGEDAVQQFWDEARLAARMIHSNIVHTYEVGEAEGRYFLAMEYLDGQSLRTLLNRLPDPRVSLVAQLRILSEVARGLAYAHELKDTKGEPLGVVHRDVSPQNVFITYDGQVKLLDFGIAKSTDAGHKTKVGVIKGKLDYIAPEQLSGDDVDARADIFAIGVMLWEAVTGKRFAGGRNTAEVTKIHNRLTGGETKLRTLVPDVAEELALIIDRAIAVQAADRWSSASDLADALDAYIDSTGSRPNVKALSEAMMAIFADERGRMHKLIDQQIEAMRGETDLTGSLPNFSLTTSATLTPSSMRDGAVGPSATVTGTGAGAAPSRRTGVVAGIVIGAAVLGAVAALATNREPEPQALAPAVAASDVQKPVAPPSELPVKPVEDVEAALATTPAQQDVRGASVSLQLTAVPASARFTLDGVELSLPFKGEFRRGSELHHIEITAKGYQPHKRLVDFNRDQVIDVVLSPAPQGRSRGGSARAEAAEEAPPPAAAEPRSPATPEPPPPSRPTFGADLELKPRAPTSIDTFNPYKKK